MGKDGMGDLGGLIDRESRISQGLEFSRALQGRSGGECRDPAKTSGNKWSNDGRRSWKRLESCIPAAEAVTRTTLKQFAGAATSIWNIKFSCVTTLKKANTCIHAVWNTSFAKLKTVHHKRKLLMTAHQQNKIWPTTKRVLLRRCFPSVFVLAKWYPKMPHKMKGKKLVLLI